MALDTTSGKPSFTAVFLPLFVTVLAIVSQTGLVTSDGLSAIPRADSA